MIKFLTSDIGASKKVDGVRIVSNLNNTNHFVDNLKKHISEGKNFVFIASNPTTYTINDSYAGLTFESFNISGFKFENLQIVDERTDSDLEKIIKNASIVFLAGGNTLNQMEYFNRINLSKILKKYTKIIIGQSAGALNLATEVYCSPEDEDELEEKRYFKGLGLTNINIEPHFKNSPHFGEENILEKTLLEDSKNKPFIAITDGSYIIDNESSQTLYGEGYLFTNGSYSQICKDGQALDVTNLLTSTQQEKSF